MYATDFQMNNESKDITFSQDVKAVIAVLKEAVSKGNQGVTFINIGQVGSNKVIRDSREQSLDVPMPVSPATEQVESTKPVERIMLPNDRSFDVALPSVDLVQEMGRILDSMSKQPQSKYNAILKATLVAATIRHSNNKSAASWLGIKYETFIRWSNKLNLRRRRNELKEDYTNLKEGGELCGNRILGKVK